MMEWYNNDWGYRALITANSGSVDESITDFVYYYPLSQLDAVFWANVQVSGGDIRVTQSDGVTEVPIHVADIDVNGQTGALFFKDTSDSSTNKDYYIYFGNSGASAYADSATYGKYNVWTDWDYVWLLTETPSGTTDEIKNATSSSGSGTYEGSTTSKSISVANSPLEMPSINFEEDDSNAINYGNTFYPYGTDLDAKTTMVWVNLERLPSAGSQMFLMTKWGDVTAQKNFFQRFTVMNLGGLYAWTSTGTISHQTPSAVLVSGDVGNWRHFAWTNDAGFDTPAYYKEGSSVTITDNGNSTGTLTQGSADTYLGRVDYASADSGWIDGSMSLFSIGSSAFSSTKISTYYNNQSAPGTFWTSGQSETAPTPFMPQIIMM